jgi:hypothetical protein
LEVCVVALFDPGPNVAGSADVNGRAVAVSELEGFEPDVKGEVGDVVAQLTPDVIPQFLERFGHGSATALRGGS